MNSGGTGGPKSGTLSSLRVAKSTSPSQESGAASGPEGGIAGTPVANEADGKGTPEAAGGDGERSSHSSLGPATPFPLTSLQPLDLAKEGGECSSPGIECSSPRSPRHCATDVASLDQKLEALLKVPEELAALRDACAAQQRALEVCKLQLLALPDKLAEKLLALPDKEAYHQRNSNLNRVSTCSYGSASPHKVLEPSPSGVSVSSMHGAPAMASKAVEPSMSAVSASSPPQQQAQTLSTPVDPSVAARRANGSIFSVLAPDRRFASSNPSEVGWASQRPSIMNQSFISAASFFSHASARPGRRQSNTSSSPPVRLQLVSEESDAKVDQTVNPEDRDSLRSSVDRMDRQPSDRNMNGSVGSQRSLAASPCRVCILHPNTHLRLALDALVVASIIATVVLAPVAVSYLEDTVFQTGMVARALNVVDGLWYLHIVLNLCTGFIEEGRIVMAWLSIFLRYARSWLLMDLISTWPFWMAPSSKEGRLIYVVLKLTRFLRIINLFSKLQRGYRSTMMLPTKVVVTIMLLAHVVSCAWRIAQCQDDCQVDPHSDELWSDEYVKDLYWVLMTMTTVGYGDISPQNTTARLFAIITMLMSPIFFGTIVSGLTHATKELFADPIDTKVWEATRFMAKRNVPQALQRRVEHNLRHHILQEHHASMDPALFTMLSPSVQRELALELLSTTVLKFPLFRNAPYSFVSELATCFSWLLCMSGDVVAEEGQLVEEAKFVMRGRLHIDASRPESLLKHRSRLTEKGPLEFGPGAWFGEACFFVDTATHHFCALALIDSEIATLQAKDYHRIAQRYPRVSQQQVELAKAIEEKRASVQQLAFKSAGAPTVRSTRASSFNLSAMIPTQESTSSWFSNILPLGSDRQVHPG